MIDKFLYNLLSKIDALFIRVDEVLTFKFPKAKKKKNGKD